MYKRYMGEFLSRKGVVWRCEIWQEADAEFSEVGDLTFDAEEPLVIEWEAKDKEEVILGATATLQVISPGDRTYIDLYSIEPGQIRLDVYREGSLYWSGALDPEFYEEPYETASGYTVALTFSDFGILDRLAYNLSGTVTLETVLSDALSRSKIRYAAVDFSTYSSTFFTDGEKADLSALSIPSDNFFDEDGEASTLKDVVEGILGPLGLRITQRAGTVWVYDLNGLYGAAERDGIEWDGDSQTLGVDKVVNNVKITFSPYADSALDFPELTYDDEYSKDMVNYGALNEDYYSYYSDYDIERYGTGGVEGIDYAYTDFTIFWSTKGSGLASLTSKSWYFHILPVFGSAEECSGVVWGFITGHSALSGTAVAARRVFNATAKPDGSALLKTERAAMPKLSEGDAAGYLLRVSMEMLLDARYNPFNSESDDNEKSNYKKIKKYTAWAFVPCSLTLYDADGNALYHYDNSATATTDKGATIANLNRFGKTGSWVEGEGAYGDMWLEWYDTDDPDGNAGIQGWQTNRHCIGRPDGVNDRRETVIFKSFAETDAGEYIPYPPEGGYLELTVYTGVYCYAYGEKGEWGDCVEWDDRELWDLVRWHLYKAPKIELIRNNSTFDTADADDVEYSAFINKDAKDGISLDTVCGTSPTVYPTAKGVYRRASTDLQISELQRAGVTDHPEKLWIGTLYSQFAERHAKLTGDALIDAAGLKVYTERNQEGKVFLLTGEVQDVITDDSEITAVELSADEYEAMEEE